MKAQAGDVPMCVLHTDSTPLLSSTSLSVHLSLRSASCVPTKQIASVPTSSHAPCRPPPTPPQNKLNLLPPPRPQEKSQTCVNTGQASPKLGLREQGGGEVWKEHLRQAQESQTHSSATSHRSKDHTGNARRERANLKLNKNSVFIKEKKWGASKPSLASALFQGLPDPSR